MLINCCSWFDFGGLFFGSFFLLLLDPFFLLIHDNPVILIVILVSAAVEQLLEHGFHGCIVGSFIKANVPGLAQVLGEFHWVTLAEHFNRCGKFLLLNAFVLVSFVVSLHALPRQHSSQEIHTHISNAFHVVPASLFNSKMGVDGGIASSACQVLTLTIRYVLSVTLDVSLGQAEVKEKYFVGGFVESNTEVVGLDVTV